MLKSIPEKYKYLFWDVDMKCLEDENFSQFVVERFLEKGDLEAVRWTIRAFSLSKVHEVISAPLSLSSVTINFWKAFFKDYGSV